MAVGVLKILKMFAISSGIGGIAEDVIRSTNLVRSHRKQVNHMEGMRRTNLSTQNM